MLPDEDIEIIEENLITEKSQSQSVDGPLQSISITIEENK